MVFSQYGNLFIVILFTLMLAPVVIANLLGFSSKYVGLLLNIPMLLLLFGTRNIQMLQFLVFLVCEIILIYSYYFVYRKWKKNIFYYVALCFSMFPIIIIKLSLYTPYDMLGFVGISYISFRIWQIIIEIKDGRIEKLPIWDLFYFVTFFPTLSSGPIDRYQRFLGDLEKKPERFVYIKEYLGVGLVRIFRGMIYKFGIAFIIQTYVILMLPEEHTLLSTIIYMYAYTLYLFFDFAGYSNFAIGTSYIMGIRVGENFNKPFLAHNMKEFWERWHMSLSSWFGDYVFKRFVLNTMRKGMFKNRRTAARVGNMVTMLVMGIWHGPYLFYILYGLYQGAALVVTDIYLKSKRYQIIKEKWYYDIVSRVVCFQVIAFGMLIFSGYILTI